MSFPLLIVYVNPGKVSGYFSLTYRCGVKCDTDSTDTPIGVSRTQTMFSSFLAQYLPLPPLNWFSRFLDLYHWEMPRGPNDPAFTPPPLIRIWTE